MMGVWVEMIPSVRRSWAFIVMWMIMPAHMNKSALNVAWVIRWKNVRVFMFSPKVNIMSPSWLRVDKAMIFLRSNSNKALIPAISIVNRPVIRMIFIIIGLEKR